MRVGQAGIVFAIWGMIAISVLIVPAHAQAAAEPAPAGSKDPITSFPIDCAAVDAESLKLEITQLGDGRKCLTVMNRASLSWQVQGYELSLQADNVVVLLSEAIQSDQEGLAQLGSLDGFLNSGIIDGIFLSGDVVLEEGLRSIRCDEMYYDLKDSQALAVNATLKTYDTARSIPIYVRAAKLRMVARNVFFAEDVTVTTSEFHVPQFSLNAARVTFTDSTAVDEATGSMSDSSFDAQLQDVGLNYYDKTLLSWPGMRSNLQQPDLPLKSVHVGNSSTWGTSLETRWHLARVLGLRESEGTDGTLLLDYFDKRGPGGGFELDYVRDDFFGNMEGYAINDHGEDRLGRTRRDLEPPRNERGRFSWQHRQFMAHEWQVTSEISYLSDENYLEQYDRKEFYQEKEQETLVHVQRIEDNWGLAFMGKGQINHFADTLEEMPTAEFHWTGQSLFDDVFTFYSDSQISRYQHKFGDDAMAVGPQDDFTFSYTRNELDLPLRFGKSKLVPFSAMTLGFEDGAGFYTNLDDAAVASDSSVWFGEMGLRWAANPLWQVYPDVRSRLWDLQEIRHIIEPRIAAIGYFEGDVVAKQRDVLRLGVAQRWQTKRGRGKKQRVVDWLRVDVDFNWVRNASSTWNGPSELIWNKSFVPLSDRFSGTMLPSDRRNGSFYGASRSYIGTDFVWRTTDSTAILSDVYYDTHGGVVRQCNVGVSHLRWPDLSLYVGSRYLREVENGLGERGSNAFTFAAAYKLDPRYAVIFSQQYDMDYGASIRSDVTLLRKYHRLNYGFTFSVDESIGDTSIAFGLWPEGIEELALGLGRYVGLGL
jgi:hypothetical protein